MQEDMFHMCLSQAQSSFPAMKLKSHFCIWKTKVFVLTFECIQWLIHYNYNAKDDMLHIIKKCAGVYLSWQLTNIFYQPDCTSTEENFWLAGEKKTQNYLVMHLVYIVFSQMLMMIDDLRTGGVFCQNNSSKFLVLVKSTKPEG